MPNPLDARGRSWVFTLNNPTDDEHQLLVSRIDLNPEVDYCIIGRERGQNGTPHLQGYIIFGTRKRFAPAREFIGVRAHIERARGSPLSNREYCSKEGDFDEYGTLPLPQPRGTQSQFSDFSSWTSEFFGTNGRPPSEREVAIAFPALFVRYSRALLALTSHLCPYPELESGDLRPWQSGLLEDLEAEPDDRTIQFFIDEEGGKGKSYFQRWFFTKFPEKVQLLSGGKRDDVAHAIDQHKSIFLFNIPRGGMEYLQYQVLEQLKDRVVFSPKYNSSTKVLTSKAHVIVFCNEMVDYSKMSRDRFKVTYI